jgi:hypothetical protein
MNEKMQEKLFLNDTKALLRPTLTLNSHEVRTCETSIY